MSVNSRGFAIAANLLLAVIAQSGRATASSGKDVAIDVSMPTSPQIVLDANWLNDSTQYLNKPLVVEPLWHGVASDPVLDLTFNPEPAQVPHPAADDRLSPAVKDDLIVPFPAAGAGWILLLGALMYRIGKRVVRPI